MKTIIMALIVILSLMVISGCVPTTTIIDDTDFSDELFDLDELEGDLDLSDLDTLYQELVELEQSFD